MANEDRIVKGVGQNSDLTAWQRIKNAILKSNRMRNLSRQINRDLRGIENVESFGESSSNMLDQVLRMVRVQSQVDSRIDVQSYRIRLKRNPLNKGRNDDPLLIIEAMKQGRFGRSYDIQDRGNDEYIITIKQI